jgi:PKHD-type hydroxylase
LRRLVLGALNRNAMFFTSALPLKILPPFFNRYSGETNHYGFHTDNAMRMQPDGSGYVRADVSATLFLSDPEDYEGGVLTVEDTFGSHGIKPKAGSMVVYPSSSIHEVSAVTQGERVACFMFMQSMVRDPGQRRLLYDMDMALLQLRQTVGETDAVVRLTGTYHNLLRQWAES